jgi:hypothetical protein
MLEAVKLEAVGVPLENDHFVDGRLARDGAGWLGG